MGAGLIQLVLNTSQDEYITQNPNISYFKYSYKKHTRFSNESIRLDFNSVNKLNRNGFTKNTCKVGRYGDLLSNIYFCFTLPAIYSSNKYRVKWVENIGNVIIKKAEITVGAATIDTITGEWMTIWNELSMKDDTAYSKIIGNTADLINPSIPQPRISVTNNRFTYIYYPESNINNGEAPSINERIIYAPINFWFTRNPSLALPLLKLQYSDIYINIELQDTESLYQVYSSVLEMYVSPTFYNLIHNENIYLGKFCNKGLEEEVFIQRVFPAFVYHPKVRVDIRHMLKDFLFELSDTLSSTNLEESYLDKELEVNYLGK
jgi:hypothetical protein